MPKMILSLVDELDLVPGTIEELNSLTGGGVRPHEGQPSSDEEVGSRIRDADGLLVSWRTRIPAETLATARSVRFIGIAASPFTNPAACNVDLEFCNANGIAVSMLEQYGDEATAEWIVWAMLSAARGHLQWRGVRTELAGKQLGVIGMGHMGRHVTRRALGLGMAVSYFSRNRHEDVERSGATYRTLDDVLERSDVVTLHVPKGANALPEACFEQLRHDALLINTSIGPTIDVAGLRRWLQRHPKGAFVCDTVVDEAQRLLAGDVDNAHCSTQMAGDTVEMHARKSRQLVENVSAFLDGRPIRIAPL